MAYGRPLKGRTRRVPVTVHAAIGLLDIIDEHVEETKQQLIGSYSRSDFYDEAVKLYLGHLGKLPEEEQDEEKNEPYQKRTEKNRREK